MLYGASQKKEKRHFFNLKPYRFFNHFLNSGNNIKKAQTERLALFLCLKILVLSYDLNFLGLYQIIIPDLQNV